MPDTDKKNLFRQESQENEEITSAIPSERSCRWRLDKKFTRFLNSMANVYGQVNESLAISNAVELFKLVYLNWSSATKFTSRYSLEILRARSICCF